MVLRRLNFEFRLGGRAGDRARNLRVGRRAEALAPCLEGLVLGGEVTSPPGEGARIERSFNSGFKSSRREMPLVGVIFWSS